MGSSLVEVPPQSLEAEACVLGAVLLDNESYWDVADLINEGDQFYKSAHSIIWEHLSDEIEEGRAADIVTLHARLEQEGVIERVGGSPYLTELTEAVPTAANARYYARIVREMHLRRRIRQHAEACKKMAASNQTEDELLAELSRKTDEIISDVATDDVESVRDTIDDEINRIMSPRPDGWIVRTWPFLHRFAPNFRPGDYVCVAGRPSMGKSRLVQVVTWEATKCGHPGVYFSLEMTKRSLTRRLIAYESGVDGRRIREKNLTQRDEQKIAGARDVIAQHDYWICERRLIRLRDIRARIRKLKRQNPEIAWVAIDYLQLMESSGSHTNRTQELSSLSRGLKVIAGDLGVTVFVISQLNRAVERRNPPKPKLSDLRGSGAIEQDADVVFAVFAADYYWPDCREIAGYLEIPCLKQRDGSVTGTGRLLLRVEKATHRMDEADDDLRRYEHAMSGLIKKESKKQKKGYY